jgi:hypothetical protein
MPTTSEDCALALWCDARLAGCLATGSGDCMCMIAVQQWTSNGQRTVGGAHVT